MTGVTAMLAGARGFVEMTVAASNVSRTQIGLAANGTVTTIAAPNTTIKGGVAPYTQAWTQVSGDVPTISDANALNPTWSATVADGEPNVSTWRVTVTDAIGGTANTTITVTLTWVRA